MAYPIGDITGNSKAIFMPQAGLESCASRKEHVKAFKSRDTHRVLILNVHET